MKQNKWDHVKNEGLENLVRGEWFAQFRWIASLSTFLIGITFTILTFMRNNTVWYNIAILSLTIIVLLTNIFIVKRIIRKGIIFFNQKAYGIESKSEKDNFWNLRDKTLPCLESWINRTFWLGITLFILFVLSYLVPKHTVKILFKTILIFIQALA